MKLGRQRLLPPRMKTVVTTPWYLSGGISLSSLVAAYQPKNAENLAASYLRVAGSAGNANLDPSVVGTGVAPTWDNINGWAGAAAAFLATGIIQTSANWSFVVKMSGVTTDSIIFGWGKTGATWFRPRTSPNRSYNNSSTAAIAVNGMVSNGVFAVAGNKAFINGVAEVGTTSQTTPTAVETYLLAYNNNGSAIYKTTGYVQAFAVYNNTLTTNQVLALTYAMNEIWPSGIYSPSITLSTGLIQTAGSETEGFDTL